MIRYFIIRYFSGELLHGDYGINRISDDRAIEILNFARISGSIRICDVNEHTIVEMNDALEFVRFV